MNPLETQVGGDHYRSMNLQPAEFIYLNNIPFLEGCVIKYVCRHRSKGKSEDIRKAIHFLELLLKLEYGADGQTEPAVKANGNPLDPWPCPVCGIPNPHFTARCQNFTCSAIRPPG